MSDLHVVVGAQYGSESKGAVAGWLASDYDPPLKVVAVRVAGPNAGHTAYDRAGRAWALRQIPVAAVTDPTATLVIAAGSEIDPDVLYNEINLLEENDIRVINRLIIDGSATVIYPSHHAAEADAALTSRIGSTGKGIGAARADRIMRVASLWRDHKTGFYDIETADTASFLQSVLNDSSTRVIIEGTQGYGLGLHTPDYPQVTSSDCRAIDFLAMAGVSPWQTNVRLSVWAVARMFPIRVAGNSGPMVGETSWGALNLPDEYTTVTKKVRRVGAWDWPLFYSAIRANGGRRQVKVALAMADQQWPDLAGEHGPRHNFDFHAPLTKFLNEIYEKTGAVTHYVGTGPNTRIWLP